MNDDDLLATLGDELSLILDQLESIPESRRPDLFRKGQLERLFHLLAPIASVGSSPYEYLLAHKAGVTLIARIRHALTQNYAIRGTVDGQEVFISPDFHQLYEDGVMFLQGKEPFAGRIGRYFQGRVTFAVFARDAISGEYLGPEDFFFVDVETARALREALLATSRINGGDRLEALLAANENRESEYQAFFTQYPWVLGAQHRSVQSHTRLDDANIPDFSAVRARDDARDILEIKPPFLPLFRGDGEFSAEFNSAWNQAERYLDFTRRDSDYLRRKGLRFENPHCYLIAGRALTPEQRGRIQAKERMNPAITFLSYEAVLALARNTLRLVSLVGSEDARGPA